VVFLRQAHHKFGRGCWKSTSPSRLSVSRRSRAAALVVGERLKFCARTIRGRTAGLRADCRFFFTDIHQAHAASAFYPRPLTEPAILTVDGVASGHTTIGEARETRLKFLKELRFPHSLDCSLAFTAYAASHQFGRIPRLMTAHSSPEPIVSYSDL